MRLVAEPEHEHDAQEAGARIRRISAGVRAPASLRVAVAVGPAPRRSFSVRPIALAGAALACLAAVGLALAPGGADVPAPSIADAAGLALRAPTGPASRGSAAGYGAASGWRPVGTSTDRIGDRTAVTVAYTGGYARAGYTVVDGPPLAVPGGARRLVYEGLAVAVVERNGLRIVTWRRGGRTCIVAARGTSLERLLDLVSRT